MLSTAPVAAFGFLRTASRGSIQVNGGELSVEPGKSVSLIGGDIRIDEGGTLRAAAGRVNLVSVQSDGEVMLDIDDPTAPLDTSAFARQGEIELLNSATVDVSGPGGGLVVVRGRTLEVENNAVIFANTTGGLDGQGIDINLRGALTMQGGLISTLTEGSGAGGSINITASSTFMDASPGIFSAIDAKTMGAGDGGNISLTTDSLEMVNTSQITVETAGTGPGGKITITARTIEIEVSSDVSASTAGLGPGGSIALVADKPLRLDGALDGEAEPLSATITTEAGTNNDDDTNPPRAGDITITTRSLEILNGGAIIASTSGRGDGGEINIHAANCILRNEALVSSSAAVAEGDAGKITITAQRAVRIEDNSTVRVRALESEGGTLTINAGGEIIAEDSIISAQAGVLDSGEFVAPVDGGNITLATGHLVYLRGGEMTASAGQNGGNVTIDPDSVVLRKGAKITAKAFLGDGGDITISSLFFLRSPDTVIDASSEFGFDGRIDITGLVELDLASSFSLLPARFNALSQLPESCGVRLSGEISSFIVVGRGALPFEPDAPLDGFELMRRTPAK